MTASLTTLLLAAICAAFLTTAAHARDLQLGTPVELAAPLAHEQGKVAPPLSEGVPTGNDIENRGLGQPRGLLRPVSESHPPQPEDDDGAAVSSPFGSLGQDAWQVLTAMAAVVALLLILRVAVMRVAPGLRGGGRPSGVLEILARYPVARGQHLLLIKLARRIILVHQNGSAMMTLSEVSDPEEVAALLGRIEAGSTSPREATRFRSLLTQFTKEHDHAIRSEKASGVRDAWDSGEVVDLTRRRSAIANLFSPSARKGLQ